MTHAIDPERLVLFCPRCRAQHEDFGEWAERPHRTHRCLFCANEWRPFPWTTLGVALPRLGRSDVPVLLVPERTFENIRDYSCSIPTGPRPFTYWRRRWPYEACPERTAKQHHFAITVPMPDDPPGEISIIWRRLLVAEWLAGDVLAELLGSAA